MAKAHLDYFILTMEANTRMKRTLIFLLVLFISSASFLLTGCKSTNELDLSKYCQATVHYKLNGAESSNALTLGELTGDSCPMQAYKTIQINTNRAWTYGLSLSKVTFDILMEGADNIDIDITISNLENGQNYNQTADTYFYHKTLPISNSVTSITLDVFDTFINKDATISIEIGDSAYNSNSPLKLAIRNFKMFGEHTPTNY